MSDSAAKLTLARFFGIGPLGFLISAVLFGLAWLVDARLGPFTITHHAALRKVVCIACSALTVFVIMWSNVLRIRAQRRGKLCTSGVYALVRHPLYAAIINLLAPALAFFMNSYVFFLWWLALYPLWGFLVRSEEKAMAQEFGYQFTDYAQKTARFIPGLW